MRWLCVAVVVLCVAACSTEDALPWWKTAVLYQVYPRSFKDSNGDGVGDLKGITQMADHFKEIGVDAVWLSPILKSPMADFGYDISDFTAIEPLFGTMEDFEALKKKLDEIGVKLLLDFVPNHTSDEHVWFQKSLKSDPDYSDFYVWRDPKGWVEGTPIVPNNWTSVFGGSAWAWDEGRKQFYLHKFSVKQPDLNFRNNNVVDNMTAILNFWMDKGVDGFRIDAAPHLVENITFPDEPATPGTDGSSFFTQDHIYTLNQPETYDLLHMWAEMLFQRRQQDGRERAIVLEIYDTIPITMSYYGTGTEGLEFPFDHYFLMVTSQATRAGDFKRVIDDLAAALPTNAVLNWMTGNHDVPRAADRYGPERVDYMNLLTGVLPGVKVTYYGEEIGMRNTFVRRDEGVDPAVLPGGRSRDFERTPMQWDSSYQAGFSTNSTTWLPVNPNYWWLNVAAQRAAQSSHLKVFQAMAQARQDPVLQRGDLSVQAPNNDTLIVARSYNNTYYVLMINMGSELTSYTGQTHFDMTVVVGTMNSGYTAGFNFPKGPTTFTLRPEAAVLLKIRVTFGTSFETFSSGWKPVY